MITNEAGLETWICNNQDEFIPQLEDVMRIPHNNLKFVGRQVTLGTEHRIDLLYYFDLPITDKDNADYGKFDRVFVVVELKFRELKVNDLAQVTRYMSNIEAVESLVDGQTARFIRSAGVLIGDGVDKDFSYLLDCDILKRVFVMDILDELLFEKTFIDCIEPVETADERFIAAITEPTYRKEVKDESERIPEDSQETEE